MEDLPLLVDLHREARRQGPGSDAETLRAAELAGLDRTRALRIADIGCGTGAATLCLARELNAEVVAVDLVPEFLKELQSRTVQQGLTSRVTTLNASMDALPFAEEEFDVIWSEGAIYNMGFQAGVSAWHRFLKPGGALVVSEITWLTSARPAELQTHWENAYPEIDRASAKLGVLEQAHYSPRAYFVLPRHCWLDNYYLPMEARFEAFLERQGQGERARAVVDEEKQEIALYRQYNELFGYGVYIARKAL